MCFRGKKGKNIGPRHIRQNWYFITIIQAVLQCAVDFIQLTHGPFDRVVLKMSVYLISL